MCLSLVLLVLIGHLLVWLHICTGWLILPFMQLTISWPGCIHAGLTGLSHQLSQMYMFVIFSNRVKLLKLLGLHKNLWLCFLILSLDPVYVSGFRTNCFCGKKREITLLNCGRNFKQWFFLYSKKWQIIWWKSEWST